MLVVLKMAGATLSPNRVSDTQGKFMTHYVCSPALVCCVWCQIYVLNVVPIFCKQQFNLFV